MVNPSLNQTMAYLKARFEENPSDEMNNAIAYVQELIDVEVVTRSIVTKWDLIDEAERRSLDNTSCNLHCSGCGELLQTEGDFARHFGLKDIRYKNLGYCPKVDING